MRKQINNLKLRGDVCGLYKIYTPDGVTCLEEFARRDQAEDWMRRTTDYLSEAGRYRHWAASVRRLLAAHNAEIPHFKLRVSPRELKDAYRSGFTAEDAAASFIEQEGWSR